jgi:chemotaxis regulatin CheY-phosphate phosphatase CheZ
MKYFTANDFQDLTGEVNRELAAMVANEKIEEEIMMFADDGFVDLPVGQGNVNPRSRHASALIDAYSNAAGKLQDVLRSPRRTL